MADAFNHPSESGGLHEADVRFLSVSWYQFVPHFLVALVLLSLLDVGVERSDEYGLERLERMSRGGGLYLDRLYTTAEHDPLASKLRVKPSELLSASHLVDEFLDELEADLSATPHRMISLRLGVYSFHFGLNSLLNVLASGLIAGFFQVRRRKRLAEELILYQNKKYLGVNQQLQTKMQESQRIIETLNRLQGKLVEAEKLASIGRLSATLAHEIRNPLSIIKSSVDLIAEDTIETPSVAPAVELIQAEISRLDRIITDLLNFARPKPPNFGVYPVKNLVRHWLPPIVEEIEKNQIQLVPQLDTDGEVMVDPDQLWQVFLNVVWNARDAMASVKRPHLFVRLEDGDEAHIRLIVRDTGTGMLPDTLRQIREPFFTTKTQGSGLGIPVSIQLMEGMGGRFEIESQLDFGTTVTLYLLRSRRGRGIDGDSRQNDTGE
jgi:C4-dicarboxylate-specific signal transduction histidine kinase